MEEKQEKKQEPEFKGKMGIVWLVGILVIILGCVTIYTLGLLRKNGAPNQVPPEPRTIAQVEAQKTENTTSEEKTTKTTAMTADEKYEIWVKKVQKEIGKAKHYALCQNVKMSNNRECEVDLTSKGVLCLTLENQGGREYDKDVISFEICDTGNSRYKAAYYIKKDGTVYYVVLDEYAKNDGDIPPIKVKNAKNIVSIINNIYTDEASWIPEVWLIDIDGNVYK